MIWRETHGLFATVGPGGVEAVGDEVSVIRDARSMADLNPGVDYSAVPWSAVDPAERREFLEESGLIEKENTT